MSRRVWFVIAILGGITLGLVYGWIINPVKYVNTNPDTLRSDYKIDYILMVAEVFQKEGNIDLATKQLAWLGETDPLQMVQQAIIQANQTGYSAGDVDLMVKLGQVLETRSTATQGKSG